MLGSNSAIWQPLFWERNEWDLKLGRCREVIVKDYHRLLKEMIKKPKGSINPSSRIFVCVYSIMFNYNNLKGGCEKNGPRLFLKWKDKIWDVVDPRLRTWNSILGLTALEVLNWKFSNPNLSLLVTFLHWICSLTSSWPCLLTFHSFPVSE